MYVLSMVRCTNTFWESQSSDGVGELAYLEYLELVHGYEAVKPAERRVGDSTAH